MAGDDTLCLKTGMGSSGARGVFKMWCQCNYRYAPHNVSVYDGPHLRQWSHKIIIFTTVLQLPTVFSTVTCCTGL